MVGSEGPKVADGRKTGHTTRTLSYADRTRLFIPAPAKTDETSDCHWAVVGVEGEQDRYV